MNHYSLKNLLLTIFSDSKSRNNLSSLLPLLIVFGHIFPIFQLSYHNPPQLPPNLPCTHWSIKCESHTPYVLDLLNSIRPNCDKLEIEIDNWNFKEIADTEQVRTAKELSLKTSDPTMQLGIFEEQILNFEAVTLYLNGDKKR
ncbi:unnamed protein product [Caenorhabditis brenneri]